MEGMKLLLMVALALPVLAEVSAEEAARIQRAVAEGMARNHIPAVSVAVWRETGAVWAAAYGLADMENFVPATPRSVFRLASVSKPFTSVAAMQLVEDGKLALESEVQRYVPSFPRKEWPVVVRQLLCHQAGIRGYQGDEIGSTKHYSSVAEGLSIFMGDPLVARPGTKYLYSSYGFNLAGAAVEGAAGEPFAALVKRRILDPSGIEAMRPDDVFAVIPGRARGYRKRADGGVDNCQLADISNKLPGGGWVATASDVARFGRALVEGRLLKAESLERMWTEERLESGETTGYGLGWGVGRRNGMKVVSHSGGQPGTATYLLVVPEKKLVVVVLTNLEGSEPQAMANALMDVMTGRAE